MVCDNSVIWYLAAVNNSNWPMCESIFHDLSLFLNSLSNFDGCNCEDSNY